MPAPVGRPSKYDPRYCEEMVAFCADGFSLTGYAGFIGVDRDTLTAWADAYPEFSLACRKAKAARTLGLEKDASRVRKDGGGAGSATLIVFGLKNFAPDEYADVQTNKLVGDANHPITIENVTARELVQSRIADLATRLGQEEEK